MTDKRLPSKIFHDKEFNDDAKILVIGYNTSLLQTLPKGTVIIDPSVSKIKHAHIHHKEKTFLTQDLTSFSLNKTFTNILSMGTLHLEKDLTSIFIHIQKHLAEDAIIYFPLSPSPIIETFLKEEKWSPFTLENIPFQKRDRSDVEEAVLSAPFQSTLIEEKIETLSFYSPEALKTHLLEDLKHLTTLQNNELDTCATELTDYLYKDQDKDHILTLKTPWILLTLSNDENIL